MEIEKNLAPLDALRLSFRDMDEYADYRHEHKAQLAAIWQYQAALGNQEKPFTLNGFCEVCNSATKFYARPVTRLDDPSNFHVKWASLRCKCGLSARERRVASLVPIGKNASIYHVGHFSNLAKYFLDNHPNVTTSQFKEGYKSGFIDNEGVRYEDLTQLSFPESSFDFIICTEVLEHIPNYEAGLREAKRCLRESGAAIFTFPWLGGNHFKHRVRAELTDDGQIHHHLPPSYHGDPASPEGILCFRDFGWEILDELRANGFRDAFAYFMFNPLLGYMTLNEPVIIAKK